MNNWINGYEFHIFIEFLILFHCFIINKISLLSLITTFILLDCIDFLSPKVICSETILI